MYSDAELQLAYKVGNVPLSMFPYPHFYIPEIFPTEFYRQLQQNLPDPEAMIPIEKARPVKGYKERFVLGFEDEHLKTLPGPKRRFWEDLRGFMAGGGFASLVLKNSIRLSGSASMGSPSSSMTNCCWCRTSPTTSWDRIPTRREKW